MNQTKLHTKQDLLAAITSNREVIKGFGVCNLGLFGSFSKGTFNETSDVDLLVDFFPELVTVMDEPIADPAAFALHGTCSNKAAQPMHVLAG